MISLDDAGLGAIMDAARPIDPSARGAFLEAVAAELGKCQEIGPGIISRTS